MLVNLQKALEEKSITYSQVAAALGYTRYATISDKIKGKTSFNFDEAVKIKKTFFPEYELEFLFANESNLQTA